jgi:hypothetical protein
MYKSHLTVHPLDRYATFITWAGGVFNVTCFEMSIPLNTYHHRLTFITSYITTQAVQRRVIHISTKVITSHCRPIEAVKWARVFSLAAHHI